MRLAARVQSATTHAAPAWFDTYEGYALILRAALLGASFEAAVQAAERVGAARVLAGAWRGNPHHAILASGYVAHNLEAAFSCVAETVPYRDAVLLAANLGDDADIIAAIAASSRARATARTRFRRNGARGSPGESGSRRSRSRCSKVAARRHDRSCRWCPPSLSATISKERAHTTRIVEFADHGVRALPKAVVAPGPPARTGGTG